MEMNPIYDFNTLKTFMDTAIFNVLTEVSKEYNLNIDDLMAKFSIVTPNNHLDQVQQQKEEKKAKKGRKKKNSEFVEMTEVVYENIKYLIDNENNVYTYDLEKPKLVGQKLVNGIFKFN